MLPQIPRVDSDVDPEVQRRDVRANLRAVLPDIAANALRAEEERRVPVENVRLLKRIGFTRAFLRKRSAAWR